MLSSSEVLKGIAKLSSDDPTKHTFDIAVFTPSGDDAWEVWIEQFPQPLIGSDMAVIALENHDNDGLSEILTVDGTTCAIGTQAISANEGYGAEMTISRTVATTLLFKQGGNNIALWSEPSFWQLFGGTKVTFKWVK